MAEINVTSTKQRILVDPAAYSVSIIYTGKPVPVYIPPDPENFPRVQILSESHDVTIPGPGLYDVLVTQLGVKASRAMAVVVNGVVYFGFCSTAVNASADIYSYYHNAVIQGTPPPTQAIAAAWVPLPFSVGWTVPGGAELGFKFRLNMSAGGFTYVSTRHVTQYIPQ